ncbi:MAG: DUF58 domain-containing protein [Planctomycetota bacterium]
MPARTRATLQELVRLQADARGFSFLPRQPVGSLLAGRHASRLRGRGLAFRELRRYALGDDVRTIDWRATARLRSAHVRVYDEERERPVLLVVDQRRPMFFGSRRATKSVAAAETAALSAWRALGSGDRVGGVVFGGDELVELRPHGSRTRALQLLHEIERLGQGLVDAPDAADSVTLDDALRAAERIARHDHLVVLISDLDGAGDESERLATRIAAHNDLLVVAVYDPLGISLRGAPGMVAARGGGTSQVPAGDAFTRGFEQEFAQVIEHWRGVFGGLRIPLFPMSTVVPPAEQLRSVVGATRARQGAQS